MRRILIAALLCGLPAVALCERLSLTQASEDGFFPGVDEQGLVDNGDDELDGDGQIKISLNTKSGKLKLAGKAQVTNQSGETQVYKDPADLDGFVTITEGLTKVKVLYKVKGDGGAKLKVSAVITDQEALDELAESLRMAGAT